jgi:hypothetical protein
MARTAMERVFIYYALPGSSDHFDRVPVHSSDF